MGRLGRLFHMSWIRTAFSYGLNEDCEAAFYLSQLRSAMANRLVQLAISIKWWFLEVLMIRNLIK
jgi:hypothetical protein